MSNSAFRQSGIAWVLISLAVAFGTTARGQPQAGGASSILQIQATTAADLRSWDAYVTHSRRAGDLQLRSTTRDPLVPGHTTERFQQFYQGVPIWGADVVRDADNGVATSIFGELSSDVVNLSVTPVLSAEQGRAALVGAGGLDASLLTEPALVIARLERGEHRLTYSAVVSGGGAVDRVFIDARTGAEVMRYSAIQAQTSAVGTGTGTLGDRKKLSVQAGDGTFTTFDTLRPPSIVTYDMKGNLAAARLVTERVGPLYVSDRATDSDNVWTDPAVVDAHVHIGWTYDFFYKRFGRSGLDGANGPIRVLTNALTQQGALSVTSADILGRYVFNAFWCGSCASGQGVMFFGNGVPETVYVLGAGQKRTYLAGSLDVAAHELTHGVTEHTSNLIYRNESGALNEAFSDMMGTAAEFYFQPAGTGLGKADYLIGEDSFRAYLPGSKSGIRSMENPGLYGDPDHYANRYLGTQDGGGVHHNSGIANQAFYLAIEGGTNRTSGLAVQGVGAANRDQVEKVFFRAFTVLLPASATFSVARQATIQAARDVYGVNSAAERAVTEAWTAVGVN